MTDFEIHFEPDADVGDGEEMVFEPDEALLMALNEVNNLRLEVEEQRSVISDLKKDLILLKKDRHG